MTPPRFPLDPGQALALAYATTILQALADASGNCCKLLGVAHRGSPDCKQKDDKEQDSTNDEQPSDILDVIHRIWQEGHDRVPAVETLCGKTSRPARLQELSQLVRVNASRQQFRSLAELLHDHLGNLPAVR